MKNGKDYIAILLKYLVPIYLVGLVLLTSFRLIFIWHFYEDFLLLYKTSDELHPILIKALGKGFRYDNIVLSYLMIFPLISLILSWLMRIPSRTILFLLRVYIVIAFVSIFALSCIDLPYFDYFWTHPTVTIFDWIGFGGTFGMLVQESSYYPYFILFIISIGIIIITSKFCSKWISKGKNKLLPSNKYVQSSIFIVAVIFSFFGTRGHLSKTPLGLNAAYFTDNKLVSDLCVTPAYHFAIHLDDYKVNLSEIMPYDIALKNAQKYLHIGSDKEHPLLRPITTDSTRLSSDKNIVIIFMESMGANQLHQEENGYRLTPFLDSLIHTSYYFENIYSSGVHTNTGVGSTLISMPSLLHQHMMSRNPITYNSILGELKKQNYSTSFFLPNEEVYDNMGLFLRANHIDTIFSDRHYPKEAKANNFGVPDDYLLNFSVDELNKFSEQEKPFFAAILTVSNHPPYVIPEEFSHISENKEKSILAYVDHAISSFFKKASTQKWYENTIFILLGDHGKRSGSMGYTTSLAYNHIPLIIHSSSFDNAPKRITEYGGQIDVLPTIMGILNKTYDNCTLGIDLLREEKPYTFFTSDNYIGCLNEQYFYTFYPKDGRQYLYDRKIEKSIENDSVSNHMKNYATSMLSTTSYMNEGRKEENN